MNRYRINDIKLAIDAPREDILSVLEHRLSLRAEDVFKWEIRRQSIDARDRSDVHYVFAVDVLSQRKILKKPGKAPVKIHGLSVQYIENESVEKRPLSLTSARRPVVVGMGPCGIFAALELAKAGLKPLVIERGPEMAERVLAVENFRRTGLLDPEANMLYGEGGAGTFSDGKLGTGIKDGRIRDVLREFADAGAGEEIMYLNKPHIGTDVLRSTIVELRHKIEELGGEIRFNTRLDALHIDDNSQLRSITVTSYSGAGISCEHSETCEIDTDHLVLAVGHSARDSFAMINKAGLDMEQKPFSIGVRMEHPQSLINESQYGREAVEKYGMTTDQPQGLLPSADYKLSTKASNGRGVYSFCMCPGGEVVVCSTAEGELCVNGMSNRKRDSGTANSGILCDVRCEDYNNGDETDILAGVRFQQHYERLAYQNGLKQHDRKYIAPQCRMAEFLAADFSASNNNGTAGFNAADSDAHYVIDSLPPFAASAIAEAVPVFARRIRGYDSPDAVIKAVETRSSSPVRILRNGNGESNIRGIYPAGEGAGYAGGITSAACDGIRAAEHIINKLSEEQE